MVGMGKLDHLEIEINQLRIRNIMRLVINPQAQFGEVNIADIQLDPKSRDDIPQLLRGLQHIYITSRCPGAGIQDSRRNSTNP